jgi:hypothetical protein
LGARGRGLERRRYRVSAHAHPGRVEAEGLDQLAAMPIRDRHDRAPLAGERAVLETEHRRLVVRVLGPQDHRHVRRQHGAIGGGRPGIVERDHRVEPLAGQMARDIVGVAERDHAVDRARLVRAGQRGHAMTARGETPDEIAKAALRAAQRPAIGRVGSEIERRGIDETQIERGRFDLDPRRRTGVVAHFRISGFERARHRFGVEQGRGARQSALQRRQARGLARQRDRFRFVIGGRYDTAGLARFARQGRRHAARERRPRRGQDRHADPQRVGRRGVHAVRRRVERQIGQRQPRQMPVERQRRGEDQARRVEALRRRAGAQTRRVRPVEQPEHAPRDGGEDAQPSVEHRRHELPSVIEAGEHETGFR